MLVLIAVLLHVGVVFLRAAWNAGCGFGIEVGLFAQMQANPGRSFLHM